MPQKLQKKGSLITSIPITSFLPGSWKRLHMGLDLCSFLLKRIYPFSWIFRKASNINKGHTDCLWLKAIRATESRAGWGWKGPVGFIWPYPLPKRGHPEAGCPGPCPDGFWISPRLETPQAPWATCAGARAPSHWESGSWGSARLYTRGGVLPLCLL